MERIKGIVKRIIFKNPENGYRVFKIDVAEDQPLICCTGVVPVADIGESLVMTGHWENNPKFGRQFAVDTFEVVRPVTSEGIYEFLCSSVITDIGAVRARKIVDAFGENTFDVLDEEPEKLFKIKGIGKKRGLKIIEAWQKERHIRDLMMFLQDISISVNLIYQIYDKYGDSARSIISENPYCLINDIWGIGFKKADSTALALGVKQDSYDRIKAGIGFVLKDATSEGHVYLPYNELVDNSCKLLDISTQRIISVIAYIKREGALIEENGRIYLPFYYNHEKDIAAIIKRRVNFAEHNESKYSDSAVVKWLQSYCRENHWEADSLQEKAVVTAICNRNVIITGGPGTGKTTILKAIVGYFSEDSESKILLAAPTGRAAQRMAEVIGIPAKTVHRLLEYNPNHPEGPFLRNGQNPLIADVIICDETSMVDMILMSNFLKAIPDDTILIFVGDSNQLPSVGAGNILADMIEGDLLPHITLKRVFRQAAKSRIVTSAHEIISGVTPVYRNQKHENCFFIERSEPHDCADLIVELISKRLPKSYNVDPLRDIQVLTPMHGGEVGTNFLNSRLQEVVIKEKEGVTHGKRHFYRGDKVMQIKNNYDENVFNGDIGYITAVNKNGEVLVDFDGKSVTYSSNGLDQLSHAYCITIHKSQGCEFPVVVIPLMTRQYIMLRRNLVYTALTRAREVCIFVGMKEALSIAVQNTETHNRYTRLAELLVH